MPLLPNPRHEAFAQARAKGAYLDDAYEDAGFTPGYRHASRVAKRPEVAHRIAELRAELPDINAASLRGVTMAMLRVAEVSLAQNTIEGVREARVSLLEALRLYGDIGMERHEERCDIDDSFTSRIDSMQTI